MNKENTRPSIVWEKWQDPFKPNYSPTHETPEDFIDQPEFFDDMNGSPNNTASEFDSDIEDNAQQSEPRKYKALVTPFGIIPYDSAHGIDNIFNFWIGHTNFDITQPICSVIEQTPGVEILDIFTRYRFRIGIGKLFISGNVLSDITNRTMEFLDTYA
jgi:hypothetical protein